MIDDQSPKEVLLREICNMRHQLTTLRATEVEYKKLKRDIECFSLLSQEMLCIIEIDGSFTYLNHATEKILGYTRDELLLKPFINIDCSSWKRFRLVLYLALSTMNRTSNFQTIDEYIELRY